MAESGAPLPTLHDELRWQLLSEPGDMLSGFLVRDSEAGLLLHELHEPGVYEMWAERILRAEPDLLPHLDSAIERMRLRASHFDLDVALARAQIFGFKPHLIANNDALQSQLFDLGYGAPRVLWLAGSTDVLDLPAVGIVGSRQCSSYGLTVASGVIANLTDDHCVVSGGAIGIDAGAHRTALKNGIPTISYLAGGPDRLYPTANLPLFDLIIKGGGAVISECAPGTPPGRWRFLQRNRLIAAHSKVLVVAECGYRSGARNTARIAGELGRAVYAAPGPITSSASAGCNLMIAQGTAECLTDFDEVADALTGSVSKIEYQRWRPPIEQRTLDELEPEGSTESEICIGAGLSRREVCKALESLSERGEAQKRGERWFRVEA